MSGWNDFCASLTRFAGKAAEATGDLADTAALRLRLSEARREQDEAFEGLGRLMYMRLRDSVDNTADIEMVMSRIDSLEKQMHAIEAELDAKRQAKAGGDRKDSGAETSYDEEKDYSRTDASGNGTETQSVTK